MSRGLLIVDGNNIGFAATSYKRTVVGDQETQGINGFLRVLRSMVSSFSGLTPIVLWDGVSWRKKIFPDYKAKRDAPARSKSDEMRLALRASWRSQRPHIQKALEHLGVRQMLALNMEADDLAGTLVRRFQPEGKRILLLSGDTDWLQLIGTGVGWLDPVGGRKVTMKTFSAEVGYKRKIKGSDPEEFEWRGVPSPRAWLDVKALMGDTADEIPGVGGIGEKGAIELVIAFGSVTSFLNQANLEKLSLPKKLADFASDPAKIDIFQRNMTLMDLNSSKTPAPYGTRLTNGVFDTAAFGDLCEEFNLTGMLGNTGNWCEPFRIVCPDLKEAA